MQMQPQERKRPGLISSSAHWLHCRDLLGKSNPDRPQPRALLKPFEYIDERYADAPVAQAFYIPPNYRTLVPENGAIGFNEYPETTRPNTPSLKAMT